MFVPLRRIHRAGASCQIKNGRGCRDQGAISQHASHNRWGCQHIDHNGQNIWCGPENLDVDHYASLARDQLIAETDYLQEADNLRQFAQYLAGMRVTACQKSMMICPQLTFW